MKIAKAFYWIVTGLMAAFMLMASIPDVLRIPQAAAIFGHLGYPVYLLPFLGGAYLSYRQLQTYAPASDDRTRPIGNVIWGE